LPAIHQQPAWERPRALQWDQPEALLRGALLRAALLRAALLREALLQQEALLSRTKVPSMEA
jgi:hypothetical protein